MSVNLYNLPHTMAETTKLGLAVDAKHNFSVIVAAQSILDIHQLIRGKC